MRNCDYNYDCYTVWIVFQVISTEAAIMEYNDKSPSFLALYNAMDGLGFGLFDVVEIFRDYESNVMTQIDVLWVRKNSSYWRKECTNYPIPSYF